MSNVNYLLEVLKQNKGCSVKEPSGTKFGVYNHISASEPWVKVPAPGGFTAFSGKFTRSALIKWLSSFPAHYELALESDTGICKCNVFVETSSEIGKKPWVCVGFTSSYPTRWFACKSLSSPSEWYSTEDWRTELERKKRVMQNPGSDEAKEFNEKQKRVSEKRKKEDAEFDLFLEGKGGKLSKEALLQIKESLMGDYLYFKEEYEWRHEQMMELDSLVEQKDGE
jgi:hypothetical protein